jgi:methionyl-tRNA formyltransferase
MHSGSDLVLDTLKLIETKEVTKRIQPEELILKSAPKLNKDNCRIDWSKSILDIYNKIRGLTPYPTAWSILENENDTYNVKIFGVGMKLEDHDYEPGSLIVSKKEVHVAVNSGFIILLEIQMPGKRRMNVRSLLNGFQFKKNAKML